MQHFHITYPHRWTVPEKVIATEYSLRDLQGTGVKYGYAQYLLFEFERGKKSIEVARNSTAKRPHPIYLGGVLVLTRIIYFVMGAMNRLPPPMGIPEGVTPRHTTRSSAFDAPKRERRPYTPKKSKSKSEDEGTSKRQTKQASTSEARPPSKVIQEQSHKEEEDFQKELAEAMHLSREAQETGEGTRDKL